MRKYTIVTVVFEDDAELLSLQARSLNLYGDPTIIEEIIVIDNFVGTKPKRWEEKLLAAYGIHSHKVRIVQAATITPIHGAGWFVQQALKLAISSVVKTDRYLVLDAKNHLVKPLARDFLEAPNDKVLINGYGYETHPLKHYLEKTCAYVGIDTAEPMVKFVRTSTPFTMITEQAKALVAEIEEKEGKNVLAVMTEHGLTEFFLYGAFLLKNETLYDLYEFKQRFSPDVWKWGADNLDLLRDTVKKVLSDTTGPFLTLHRGALQAFAPAAREIISEIWVARGLFPDVDAAYEFLSNFT